MVRYGSTCGATRITSRHILTLEKETKIDRIQQDVQGK